MITSLSMKNFKVFEDETLELDAFNILTGLNSSGKSSVIQAIRLLIENDPLPGMGPLKEYIRHDSKKSVLTCSKKNGMKKQNNRFSFNRDGAIDVSRRKIFAKDEIISYISADRYGPRNMLPLNIDGSIRTVGDYGEHIVDFLRFLENERLEALKIPETLTLDGETSVKRNIQAWLRKISPGTDLDYKSDERADMGRIELNRHRPAHVGFGLSYTLPVIASVLVHTAQIFSGDITSALLMIENPEAHLHPSGQTMMGQLLSRAANCGTQIIVETHSDHLLNGVRLAVKEGLLPHENVKCYFFKIHDENKTPDAYELTRVDQVTVDKNGMLDYWPAGFFDETEKNLLQLI